MSCSSVDFYAIDCESRDLTAEIIDKVKDLVELSEEDMYSMKSSEMSGHLSYTYDCRKKCNQGIIAMRAYCICFDIEFKENGKGK